MAKKGNQIMSNCSRRLKQLLLEKKKTPKELCADLGVSYSVVIQYLSERRSPSIKMQEKLADYFSCDVDYLMGRSDIRKSGVLKQVVDDSFSYDEVQLIVSFREAPEYIQQAIKTLLIH